MCCRDNLKAVRGEREGEKTDERNSDCGFLDCGFLSDLGQSHPLLGKSHERERESARRREEGLFYGPIAEREEWLERDEGGGTQTEEGWSHSEEGREREKGGDFILQQYIGRDARNLSSIKVCIQRGERCLRLWNSSCLQSSATIITLAKCVLFGTPGTSPHCTDSLESLASHMGAQVFRLCEDEQFSLCVRLWQPWKTFLNL